MSKRVFFLLTNGLIWLLDRLADLLNILANWIRRRRKK